MIFLITPKRYLKNVVMYSTVLFVALFPMTSGLTYGQDGMIESKLKAMAITLPEAGKPIGSYVTSVRTGNLLYTSGHIPYNDGKTKLTGKLGRDLTVEEGNKVARNVALNCLATVKASIGDLDKVKRIVKVLGLVNATEDFKDQPKVMNGASDLLVEIFGEKGKHARSAVGVASLPNGVPVEIEMILEVE
jgi:enamine deaminase RidA (YjgF/YER057c/UK114 family)